MVHSFFVSTLNAKSSRIIYSQAFFGVNNSSTTCENAENGQIKTMPSKLSTFALQGVANRVVSECLFYGKSSAKSLGEEDYFRAQDGDTVPDLLEGVFKTTFQDDGKEKLVLWNAGFSCVFVMVIEVQENLSQAKNVLSLLIRVLHSKAQALVQPSNLYLKSDRVNIIMKRLLPNGQLLFLNNRIIRIIEKDIDNKIAQ